MLSEGPHVKDLWREIEGFSAVLDVLGSLDGLFTVRTCLCFLLYVTEIPFLNTV